MYKFNKNHMPESININKNNQLKYLPSWNLADIYKSINSVRLHNDINFVKNSCIKFEKKYEKKLNNLSSEELYKAILKLEKISQKINKLSSYAYLKFAENTNLQENKIFFQKIKETLTNYTSRLVFFKLELNLLNNTKIKKYYKFKKLKKYQYWIENIRSYKPHQLEKNLEQLINEKNITSYSSWSRLFDETIATLRFPFKGKNITTTEILNYMSDKNANKRKKSALVLGETLKNNINIFTTITNTLAKDKIINDNWRRFSNPVESRNLSNKVENEVVESLSKSVQNNYKVLSHRYYKLKSKWFKKKQLMYWDRNAPLPFQSNTFYSWREAKDIVLNSYGSFSNEMMKIAKLFFDNNWIDAPIRNGKQSGAFSASTAPDVHPYILLNYQGKIRDVATLAHELGHGIHQFLAAKQGQFNSSTPLTLAETASVFGEMLTFKYLLSNESNLLKRKALIANKVEDMINTVVRQIAFYEFEKEIHFKRKNKELTTEEICDIWLDKQRRSLGPHIKIKDNYKYYWSYIPHFIHSPFYVYAYAFGDCLVNTLFSVYENNPKGFENKYMNLLKAGGSKKYTDLLKPFDLNIKSKDFWNKGLKIISNLIDELEYIDKKL